MSALSKILRLAAGNRLHFWCPGCDRMHGVGFGEGDGPRWTWNGDAVKPTFQPSVLVQSGHYIPGHIGECWCSYYRANPDKKPEFKCSVCHSFVVDGKIQFLSDCTHALAGQTVDLPEWTDFPEEPC